MLQDRMRPAKVQANSKRNNLPITITLCSRHVACLILLKAVKRRGVAIMHNTLSPQ
jgi:hypothetical protein